MHPSDPNRPMTRDITYATAAQSRAGRLVIRAMENATGRLGLIRRAQGYEAELGQGRSFWQVIPERLGLTLDITAGSLDDLPREGPLVVIANHPFGILDGLMLGHMLDQARQGEFRILANAVFRRARELDRILLPISFEESRAAVALNLQTRAAALAHLGQGGAIGVFPGGTVSTSARAFSHPMDPGWRNFTAKMIAKSGATVVPVYFDGHNSRLFQIASRLHTNLRLGLLIRELKRRVDEPVRVVIGKPIAPGALAGLQSDPNALMQHLRRATYALSPVPLRSYDPGYEFEAKYKSR
ncbi:MAG: lysophospholipid acyltransferase family protein [Rhodobacteraceae bacterium]|nr:lysophospholipid acyltransferase family protein [Paracoccaceae bacterium]